MESAMLPQSGFCNFTTTCESGELDAVVAPVDVGATRAEGGGGNVMMLGAMMNRPALAGTIDPGGRAFASGCAGCMYPAGDACGA